MPYPTTTAASDVWSMKDQYKAKAGGNWPARQVNNLTITSIGTFVTQSSADVTGIDLTGVSTSDQLIIVYGVEVIDATPVTSATLGGESATLAVATNSSSASTAVFFMPATNVGGSSGLTFACTAGTGIQYRAAVSIFSVDKSSALESADTDSSTDTNDYSSTINFAEGGVLVTSLFDETDPASVSMNGVDTTIFEEMGSASSDFYIGYSGSGSSGGSSHSIGYTATVDNAAFVAATFT